MEQPLYQITMTYNSAMLKQSVFRYWKKTLGWGYFLAMISLSFGLFINVDSTWITGVIATIFIMSLILAISVYIHNRYYVLGTFYALQNPTVSFTVYTDCFKLSSDLGKGEWPWSAIKEVWRYDNTWLVFFARSSYSTFPLETIPQQAQSFILDKIQNNGGIIH